MDPSIPPRLRQRWFAWLMSRVSRKYNRVLGERKAELLRNLSGRVLEIGPGTGANLRFFLPEVHWLGLEPNLAMHPYLRAEAQTLGRKIELLPAHAEAIPLPDDSVDHVVSTLVLCSVRDPDRVAQEILRVLRPGGTLVLLEHIAAAPDTWLFKLQHAVAPLWAAFNDGCHPDRHTLHTLERSGFTALATTEFKGPLPIFVVRKHVAGTARKPS